jgi:Zn-dependent protease with chaperone function
MILPYFFRLLCLCFASFLVLNAVAGLLVRAFSKSALRFADSRTPRSAARFLLALRMLPLVLAALFVSGLCVPSYLRFEPALTAERVGVICLLLGLLGGATWLLSIARSAHALLVSLRHNRLCQRAGQETHLSEKSSTLLVIENETPLLAMSGLLRPHLLVSSGVLRALSVEELDAALSHEHAHRASRDNAKRFLLLLAPDSLPFVSPLRALERGWSKFTEWAADDQATAGDPRRALSLAAALVRVARMGSSPTLPRLSTSLLAGDLDLSARVDRLLHESPRSQLNSARTWPTRPLLRIAGFLFAGCVAVLFLAPSTLSLVHKLLEHLLR